ncbi:MAG: adenylyl-sulfate kinase, partial [Nitrospinae bacterium]|nr:adenylyl-sulfate kinase [Nitrospinota bacterium]
YCDQLNKKSWIIDGDSIRDFFDNDLGFERDDRVQNIKRILLAAHVLSENGVIAIVCNISPFEELRRFARRKLKNYQQIYLKKNLESSRREDVKDMYRNHVGKTPVVGMDLQFDEPQNSDLVLDIENETVEESFHKIKTHLQQKFPEYF